MTKEQVLVELRDSLDKLALTHDRATQAVLTSRITELCDLLDCMDKGDK